MIIKIVLFCLIFLNIVISSVISVHFSSGRTSKNFVFIKNPEPCEGRIGSLLTDGYCENFSTCLLRGGFKVGKCEEGTRICCQIRRNCDAVIKAKYSYIINEDFPTESAFAITCQNTIWKYNKKTCQVRLDFEELELEDPSVTTGLCQTEYLEVTNSHPNFKIPKLCGKNSGQHMYLTYPENGNQINIKIKATDKKWLIKVTQIECQPDADPSSVPAGCLQYWTSDTGTVNALIYDTEKSMAYDVCIEKFAPSCNLQIAISPLLNLPYLGEPAPIIPPPDIVYCTINVIDLKDLIKTGYDCVANSDGYLEIMRGHISSCQQPSVTNVINFPVNNDNTANYYCGNLRAKGTTTVVSVSTTDYRVRIVTSKSTVVSNAGIQFGYVTC